MLAGLANELGNNRVSDGILHLDFVAQPSTGIVEQVVTPINVSRTMMLGSQPQNTIGHSSADEMS